nr:hypothetical protein Itr_chr09CG17390 [Ipomoea trifida]
MRSQTMQSLYLSLILLLSHHALHSGQYACIPSSLGPSISTTVQKCYYGPTVLCAEWRAAIYGA